MLLAVLSLLSSVAELKKTQVLELVADTGFCVTKNEMTTIHVKYHTQDGQKASALSFAVRWDRRFFEMGQITEPPSGNCDLHLFDHKEVGNHNYLQYSCGTLSNTNIVPAAIDAVVTATLVATGKHGASRVAIIPNTGNHGNGYTYAAAEPLVFTSGACTSAPTSAPTARPTAAPTSAPTSALTPASTSASTSALTAGPAKGATKELERRTPIADRIAKRPASLSVSHPCTMFTLKSHERLPSRAAEAVLYVGSFKLCKARTCNGKHVFVRPSVDGTDILGNKFERPLLYLFWLPPSKGARGVWAVSSEDTCARGGKTTQLLTLSNATTPDQMPVQGWLSMRSGWMLHLGVQCTSMDAADAADVSTPTKIAHLRETATAASVDEGLGFTFSQIFHSRYFVLVLVLAGIIGGSWHVKYSTSIAHRRRQYHSITPHSGTS